MNPGPTQSSCRASGLSLPNLPSFYPGLKSSLSYVQQHPRDPAFRGIDVLPTKEPGQIYNSCPAQVMNRAFADQWFQREVYLRHEPRKDSFGAVFGHVSGYPAIYSFGLTVCRLMVTVTLRMLLWQPRNSRSLLRAPAQQRDRRV